MKKLIIGIVLAVVLIGSLVPTAVFAGIGSDIKANGDYGKHYQINVIGVTNTKNGDFDNPARGTVFVKLSKTGAVQTKINFEPNTADPDSFAILDGNGTDGEATIAVPYEYYSTLSYNVYAIPLGKPNGQVNLNAVYDLGDATGVLVDNDIDLFRNNSKPIVTDISDIFRVSGSYTDPVTGVVTSFNNVWIFNVPWLESYYWDYTNTYCKLVQLRFYETTSGSWSTTTPTP